jgi:hypothetical protein
MAKKVVRRKKVKRASLVDNNHLKGMYQIINESVTQSGRAQFGHRIYDLNTAIGQFNTVEGDQRGIKPIKWKFHPRVYADTLFSIEFLLMRVRTGATVADHDDIDGITEGNILDTMVDEDYQIHRLTPLMVAKATGDSDLGSVGLETSFQIPNDLLRKIVAEDWAESEDFQHVIIAAGTTTGAGTVNIYAPYELQYDAKIRNYTVSKV